MENQFIEEPISFDETKDVKTFHESISVRGVAWPLEDIPQKDILSIKGQQEKEKPKRTRKN